MGDAPEPRLAQGPELGVEVSEVGELYHRYDRAA